MIRVVALSIPVRSPRRCWLVATKKLKACRLNPIEALSVNP
jgi:hypothetical protein